MDSMSMVERVARALCRDNTGKEESWGMWTDSARAALLAVLTPTPRMIEAGFDAAMGEISDDFDRIEARSVIGRTVLRAMIRSAMEGE